MYIMKEEEEEEKKKLKMLKMPTIKRADCPDRPKIRHFSDTPHTVQSGVSEKSLPPPLQILRKEALKNTVIV